MIIEHCHGTFIVERVNFHQGKFTQIELKRISSF